MNKAKIIYDLARKEPEKQYIVNYENKIINMNDPEYMYKFASNIEGADIGFLEQAIINIGVAKFIYEFARDVPGANVEKLERALMKGKAWEPSSEKNDYEEYVASDEYDGYYGADKPLSYYIYMFAKDVPGANIELLQDRLCEADDWYAEYIMYEFARDIKGADKELLQEGIISNDEAIYKFARDIKGANVNQLQSRLINNLSDDWNTCRYVYKFARDVEDADIKTLNEKLVIYCENPEILYMFACDVPEADMDSINERLSDLTAENEWINNYIESLRNAKKPKQKIKR